MKDNFVKRYTPVFTYTYIKSIKVKTKYKSEYNVSPLTYSYAHFNNNLLAATILTQTAQLQRIFSKKNRTLSKVFSQC